MDPKSIWEEEMAKVSVQRDHLMTVKLILYKCSGRMGLCSTKVNTILPDASQFWSCVLCSKYAEWEAHYMVRCTCPMRIRFPFSLSFTVTQ